MYMPADMLYVYKTVCLQVEVVVVYIYVGCLGACVWGVGRVIRVGAM